MLLVQDSHRSPDNPAVVKVTKGSESYQVTFSAMTYAKSKAASTKPALASLAKSMYQYYQKASRNDE